MRPARQACVRVWALMSEVGSESHAVQEGHSETDNEEVHLAEATEDVRHLARLRQDPEDADPPSGDSGDEIREDWEELSAVHAMAAEPEMRDPVRPLQW